MNDFELTYFTEYIDFAGFRSISDEIPLFYHLLFCCLEVKKAVSITHDFRSDFLIPLLDKLNLGEETYIQWQAMLKSKFGEFRIDLSKIRDIYPELSTPVCLYCKKCSIDVNFLVDETLKMSLPYSNVRQDLTKYTMKVDEEMLQNCSQEKNHINKNNRNGKERKESQNLSEMSKEKFGLALDLSLKRDFSKKTIDPFWNSGNVSEVNAGSDISFKNKIGDRNTFSSDHFNFTSFKFNRSHTLGFDIWNQNGDSNKKKKTKKT